MAKTTLPTNFKDDILNASMNGKRRYNLIQNSDGTYSLEDVSTYDQVGSEFTAANMNATNKNVNESADKNKIVKDLETISAIEEAGYIPDALALKEVNDSLIPRYSESIIIIPEDTKDITDAERIIDKDSTIILFNKTLSSIAAPFIRLYINNCCVYESPKLQANSYNYEWTPPFRVKKGDKIRYTLTADNSPSISRGIILIPF